MKKALILGAMLAYASAATASPLTIGNFEGGFSNTTGGACIDFDNQGGNQTDAVFWGDRSGSGCPDNDDQSGYLFNPTNNSFTFDGSGDPNPFSLGTFTLQNEPINSGTAITGVRYDLSFDSNGTPNGLNLVFNFLHNETPNPSGDNFNVTVNPGTPVQFTRGGDTYLFSLLGFGTGNGVYVNGFATAENTSASRNLYGQVLLQRPPTVPEPASILLFGTALAFGARRLRRAQR